MAATSILIAKTHLLAKKKQTLVAVLGVTFGIAMYVLMSGVMNGVNIAVDGLAFETSPHIHLYNEAQANRKSVLASAISDTNTLIKVYHQKPKHEKLNIHNVLAIMESLRNKPEVKGVSGFASSPVFYNYGAVQINGNIMGVDIQAEDQLFGLSHKMKEGSINNLLSVDNGILMGFGLAKKLNVEMGSHLVVTTPLGKIVTLKVVGIYKMGLGAIDNLRCYTNLNTVQNILQKDNSYITDINIKIKDNSQAKFLAPKYATQYECKAEDWETTNSVMVTGNRIRGIMAYVVSFTLLIVAGFGIYNIMSMTVNDKLKDIAILKATGFSSSDIVRIFMIQAVVIGFLGALSGMAIGFTLCFMLSRVPFDGGDFLSLDTFPVDFNPQYYITAVVFGIVTTILAAYTPSRKASKVDPVDILRG